MTSVSVSAWRADGSTDVCKRCEHIECCMARGDVLPLGIEIAGYTPRPEAQRLHDDLELARAERAQVDALMRLIDRS